MSRHTVAKSESLRGSVDTAKTWKVIFLENKTPGKNHFQCLRWFRPIFLEKIVWFGLRCLRC